MSGALAVREESTAVAEDAAATEGVCTESARSAIRHALAPIAPIARALRSPVEDDMLTDNLAEIAAMGADRLDGIHINHHMAQLPFTRESVEVDLVRARALLVAISVLAEDLYWQRGREHTDQQQAVDSLAALVAWAEELGAA